MAVRPGDVIAGRFEIACRAAAGGMGDVYRATDRRTGDPVAIKILRGREDAQALRFAREVEVLADQRHPATVRYLAHGAIPSGEPFLAMEWLEGETLSERLNRAAISASESVAVVARVASTLGAIHARGVVHRDLKPSNIFLRGGSLEDPILIDFGIARPPCPAAELTSPGAILGTPGYIAPEQAQGRADLDARADVYSLGCVLYRCLTGEPPFSGEDLLAVLLKVVLEDPPRIRAVRPDLPVALEALVTAMLSTARERRPRDGAEVAAALRTLGDDLEAAARIAPGSIRESAELTTSERRVMCLVVARRVGAVTDATLSTAEDETRHEALQAIAVRHRARIELLGDGSIVLAMMSAGAATDLAARAAWAALSVASLLDQAKVAIVTGRSVLEPRLPTGELIDRAVGLMRIEPRAIRLDEVTRRLIAGRFEVGADAVGPHLVGERAVLAPARTLLGKPTPCVGRERELTLLETIFAGSAEESTAGAVLVIGAPGVGKSRLGHEVLRRIRARGEAPEVWTGRGDPITAGSAFNLLGQAIRGAVGVRAGDPIEARRARLRDHVGALFPGDPGAARRVSAFLGEMVGTPFHDDDDVQLRSARRDPALMGDQMRIAFERFLAASAAARPIILVLEDLQWGDLPTVRFLDAALRNLRDRPFAVLAIARPEVTALFPGLWAGRSLHTMHLGELGRGACERLVKAVLGPDVHAETLKITVDRSLGNAFYLEELIRAAAERKHASPPETILAMVHARLEALDGEARRVLRAASIFGATFWPGAVATLLGGMDVARWMALLVDRELVAPSGEGSEGAGKFPGEVEHRFCHALIREAAYGMLTDRDREVGHQLAGEWLERAGEVDAAALAEHFERGGAGAKAAAWYERAAEQAYEGNDFAAAIDRADRAVACLVAAGASGGAALGPLKLLQAGARRWRGENVEAARAGAEAIALIPRGSDLWCRAAAELCHASGKLGDAARITALGRDLLEIAHATEGRIGLALALGDAAHCVRFFTTDHALADALRGASEAIALGHADAPEVLALVQSDRATSALLGGDVGEYLRWSEEARASAARAGLLRDGCHQAICVGYAQIELGAHAEAEETLREALRDADAMGLSASVPHALQNLGIVAAVLGKIEEARALEERALDAYRAQDHRRGQAGTRIYLAKISMMAGDFERSVEEATAVLEAAPLPVYRALALALVADARRAQGRIAEALEAAEEAGAILGSIDAIDEGEALIRAVLAEVLAAAGHLARAKDAIAVAKDRLLARADKIADPARRRTFLESVPDNARTLDLARRLGDVGVHR